jgi:uncharacterized protein
MSALELTVYEDARQFAAEADAFLNAEEAANSMIAVPAARMASKPNDDDIGSYMALVRDGVTVVAAAFHGASGGILLTAAPVEAVALFAVDLAARGRRPKGVVGPLNACEAFAGVWREHTQQVHALRYHLRHFELRSAPARAASAGCLRLPDKGESALLAQWQLAIIDELALPDDRERALRNLEQRVARGLIRVWDAGGAAAFAGFREVADIARIAPVYTPPQLRGRGYASAMVTELARELFAAGKRAIFLTTDAANPTSNAIYRRIGFRPVADHYHFDLVEVEASA